MENATRMAAMGGMVNRREVLVWVTFVSNLFEPLSITYTKCSIPMTWHL